MEKESYPYHKCVLHEAQLTQLVLDVKEIKEDVNGNGKRGIKVQVAIMEETLAKDFPKVKQQLSKLTWMVAVATGAALVLQPFIISVFLHMLGGKE